MTGGFGFLGGHLVEALLRAGVGGVHVVDNLSSNPVSEAVLLSELSRPDAVTYDLCTVADYIGDSPEDFDAVFHLASVVGPAGVLAHGGRIVSTVVTDTYLLAEYAAERRSRLIDVSTSEVYGGGRDGLCREGDPKIVPAETSCRLEYAIAKLAAETALINLHEQDGLDAVIVRPFNIAGPRQSGEGGFVLPRFLAQARLDLPLTIFGSGEARRAFTHVADLADGVLRAGIYGDAGRPYNLGNHNNVISVDDLADHVLRITGSRSVKQYIDPTELYGPAFVEANDKFPEAGQAVSHLGWRPVHDVETIVTETWEYMSSAPPATFTRLAGSKLIEQMVEAQGHRASIDTQ